MYSMNERITAHFTKSKLHSIASYSPCKQYRYSLTRTNGKAKNSLLFILLNPSVATERKNDPTVIRCEKRALILGYQSFTICNLFAFRTNNPKIMKNFPDPIGPQNNLIIEENLIIADKVLCGWGNNGIHLKQAETVLNLIKITKTPPFHFGLTKINQPTHPLYVSYNQKPIHWF